jgi:SSS family solute:Na+ symporter
MTVHLPLLLAYSAVLVGLGLWLGRRVSTAHDFFVAGRRLGPGLLGATLLAANIGAGSTVGAAGLGYRDGLAAWWWVGSAGLGSLVLAFVIGPRIRGEAGRLDLHTLGDYLEARYGASVRALVTTLLWAGTLAILAGQLIALAWVLNVVAGIPKVLGCLIGGLVMTTYFVAGGLLGSAWVNLVQLSVLLGGFAVALPVLLAQVDGLAGLRARATPATPEYWNFWQRGASGWHYLALLGPAFFVSPGLLQKIYGARNQHAVRVGTAWNAIGLLAFAIVPPLFGMIARALHPVLPHHELALPTLLMQNLPPLLGSVGLAALFSAEVSTADAILFMLATSLSRDLYKRFVNPIASDAQVLFVARGAAICGAALGLLIAIVSPSVIGVLSVFYTLLSVSLFVPVVAGLFARRVGTPEALAAILGGVLAVVAIQLSPGLVAGTGLNASAAGLLVSIAAALVAFTVRCAVRN